MRKVTTMPVLTWTKAEFHASVEYFPGAEKPHSGDKGPFAEDIMPWLGQFFKTDRATARVTAAFVYSGRRWAASLPLPMRLPIGLRREVEIVGDGHEYPYETRRHSRGFCEFTRSHNTCRT